MDGAIKLNTSKDCGKTEQQKVKLILIDRVLIFYPN